MGKSIATMAVSVLFLLVPLHAVSKDLLPAGQTVQAPQKAVSPEGKIQQKTVPSPSQEIKPLKSPAPVQKTKPVIDSHLVRNLRSVPAGEEVEVVLKGRHLDRLTSAKVLDGPRELKEIKVIPVSRTPAGWTLKLSGRKEALGKTGLLLLLTGRGQRLEVPLSGEIAKARSLAGFRETPAFPVPSEKQRALEKIKEREGALEAARPLEGGEITSTRPAARADDVVVRTPVSPGAGAPPPTSEPSESPPRSMEFGSFDFIGVPFLRSLEFRGIDFIGMEVVRSMELNHIDFIGFPDR